MMRDYDYGFEVAVWEKCQTEHGGIGAYSVEVDRRSGFATRDAAIAWADENGYLDSTLLTVELVDQDGEQEWL